MRHIVGYNSHFKTVTVDRQIRILCAMHDASGVGLNFDPIEFPPVGS